MLILSYLSTAQNNVSLETTLHVGKVFKHSPLLLFKTPPLSIGYEINASKRFSGKKIWQQWRGYPSAGVSFLHWHLGDPSVLGNVLGIMPTLDVRLNRHRRHETDNFFYRVGVGAAYATRYYDINTNPLNNGIGAPLSILVFVNLQYARSLTPEWKGRIGLSFSHFSNGSSQLPNYGINVPALNVAAIWQPKKWQVPTFTRHDSADFLLKKRPKWGFNAHLKWAWVESGAPRGPLYPVQSVVLMGCYNLSQMSRLGLGFEYEYNRAGFDFALQNSTVDTREEARALAKRYSLVAANEIFFGDFAIWFQTGVYLHETQKRGLLGLWHNNLGLRYHFTLTEKTRFRPHLGVYLKAHRIVAEYFAVSAGISL